MTRKAPTAVDLSKPIELVQAPATVLGRDKDYDRKTPESALDGLPENHPIEIAKREADPRTIAAADGQQVVMQQPWSEAATGVFLILGVANNRDLNLSGLAGWNGWTVLPVTGAPVGFVIGTVRGRAREIPTAPFAGFSSFLEMPADLATDVGKQEYVKWWIEDVTAQCITQGVQRVLTPQDFTLDQVKLDVAAFLRGAKEILDIVDARLEEVRL